MTSYGPQETVDFMFRFVNASEIEPEALADFRLNDFGDRLAWILHAINEACM